MSFDLPAPLLGFSDPVSILLAGVVDYAGLFPPAALGMADAVQWYSAYRDTPRSFALGRFIVPVARLDEFSTEYGRLPADVRRGWRLSALATGQPVADCRAIDDFNTFHPQARIIAVETKATTPADVPAVTGAFPRSLEVWVEIPSAGDPTILLAAIKKAECGAKIRLGGITAAAFPPAADVARFLTACHAAGVICKATAGLHHPLRGDYPLTYESTSPTGRMFGFLNVFLAAALIRRGGSDTAVLELLDDTVAANFSVLPNELAWRGHRFTREDLAGTRQFLCRSFGSCSFAEPIEGLQALHWL